jgi:hypothetical protein
MNPVILTPEILEMLTPKQQKKLRDYKYYFISQVDYHNQVLEICSKEPQTKRIRDDKYESILYKIFYRACLTCDIDSVELFHKKLTTFHLEIMEYSEEKLSEGEYLDICDYSKDEFNERIKFIKYIKKIKLLGVTSIL